MRRFLQMIGSIYRKVAIVCFPLSVFCLLPSIYFNALLPRILAWQEYFKSKSESEAESELGETIAIEQEWNVFAPPKLDYEFKFDMKGARSEQVLNGLEVARKATPQSQAVMLVDEYSSVDSVIEVYLIPPTEDGNVLKLTIHNVHVRYLRQQSGSALVMQ